MTCAVMLQVQRQSGKRYEIYILSDGQATIKVLNSTTITSKTVRSCFLKNSFIGDGKSILCGYPAMRVTGAIKCLIYWKNWGQLANSHT